MGGISTILQKDIAQLKKLDENRRFLVIVFIIVLFIVSIAVGAYINRFRTPSQLETTAPETPVVSPKDAKPTTALALSPAVKTLTVGQSETVSVVLSKVPVTAIDVVLTFDNNVLTVSDVQNGDVFDTVIRRRIEPGQVLFSANVKPENKNALKEGTVMTFKVTPKKAAESAVIGFDSVKTLTGLDGENTLGTTTGGEYKVVNK